MVKRGQKNGTLNFSLDDPGHYKKVMVAGDFSDWEPLAMRKQKGSFSIALPVGPGRHQYKFIVDGTWMLDPENLERAVSPMGTINSVAIA